MTEKFEVGEVAIVHHPENTLGYNGEYVEITDLPQPADYVSSSGLLTRAGKYTVLFRGKHWSIWPKHLRKRRPPQDWVKLCNLNDIPREVEHV